MFTQADQTLSRSRGGLGIGLTLVRSLVEMHDGRVAARSDGPGRGASSPSASPSRRASPADAPDDDAASADDDPGLQLPRRRILVVDDNRSNATSLGVLLRRWGRTSTMAYDGLTALELVAPASPRRRSCSTSACPAWTATRSPAAAGRTRTSERIMLVAMTGYGKEEDRRRSQEAGFNAHLVKPVNLEDLRSLLNQPDLPAS